LEERSSEMLTLVLDKGDDNHSKMGQGCVQRMGKGKVGIVAVDKIQKDAPVLLLLSERSSPFQVDYSPYPNCQRLW
jgi:hypothetical protein